MKSVTPAEFTPRPKPRLYNIGDTIVITGPTGKSAHIGERAIILDFNYLPSSYRKGYRDYMVSLEIIDPPHLGDRIHLQGGYMKPIKDITPELISQQKEEHERRKERITAKRRAKSAGLKAAKKLATPELIAELHALKEKDFKAYEDRLSQLAGHKQGEVWPDTAWVTFNKLRYMSW